MTLVRFNLHPPVRAQDAASYTLRIRKTVDFARFIPCFCSAHGVLTLFVPADALVRSGMNLVEEYKEVEVCT